MSDRKNFSHNDNEQPKSDSSGGLGIAAMAGAIGVCCLGPVLLASASFGGALAWLMDGGTLWVLAGIVIAGGLFLVYKHRIGCDNSQSNTTRPGPETQLGEP